MAFLEKVCDALGLTEHMRIEGQKVERVESGDYDVIAARAFASLPKLFALVHRFSRPEALWLLPKGKSAQEELEAARWTWQGDFALHASLAQDDAFIIAAHNARPRRRS